MTNSRSFFLGKIPLAPFIKGVFNGKMVDMKKELCFIFVFCLLAGFFLATPALAHQPRIVSDSRLTLIKNPEVSQAFYGELKGSSANYLLELKQAGDLYLQILVPDLPGIQKDKTAGVEYLPELGEGAVNFAQLDLPVEQWKKYFEEYAGDNYFKGPELKKPAEPGYYVVKISSPDNQGKYVLVVGEKEEFPAGEAVKAAITIPMLKKDFFQQPVTQWFNGKIGRYVGLGLIGLLVLGLMFRQFNKVYK